MRGVPVDMAKRRGRRRSRGTAMTEAAIVSPLFFALLFGVIEMGILFLFAQQLHRFAGFRRNPWLIAKHFKPLLNKEGIIEL